MIEKAKLEMKNGDLVITFLEPEKTVVISRESLAKAGLELVDHTCPKCWHPHLDYNDEPCVSCGCEFGLKESL